MRGTNAQRSTLNAQKKGFTLVELIIVMSVVAVMSTVMITLSVTGNLEKARDRRRETDLEAIRSVLEMYRSDTGAYPQIAVWKTSLSPYIATVPTDPKSGEDYSYTLGSVACPIVLSTAYCLCTNERERLDPYPTYCVSNP